MEYDLWLLPLTFLLGALTRLTLEAYRSMRRRARRRHRVHRVAPAAPLRTGSGAGPEPDVGLRFDEDAIRRLQTG